MRAEICWACVISPWPSWRALSSSFATSCSVSDSRRFASSLASSPSCIRFFRSSSILSRGLYRSRRKMTRRRAKLMICATNAGRLKPRAPIPRNTVCMYIGPIRSREPQAAPLLEDEADHHRRHQRIDADGFGKGQAENHVGLDHGLGLGIAAEGVERAADHVDRKSVV